MRHKIWIWPTAALLAAGAAAGCAKKDVAGGSAGGAGATQVAANPVYQSNGCARCHSIGGQGGQRGPDLSHVGADPKHTPQWLAGFIKNPQSVNPGSRMPAFAGRISDADLTTLGTYLAGLK